MPAFVHWVHGTGALLIVAGLSGTAVTDSSLEKRFGATDRNRARRQPNEAWMRPIDESIVEILAESDLVLTPAVVAYNIGYSREEVNRRLSELETHGLVERVERSKYRITDDGRGWSGGSCRSTRKE
ncbi:MAG: winged-helix domain-containing protein [Halalkalicoccus sp.]